MKKHSQKIMTGIITAASVLSLLLSPLGSRGGVAADSTENKEVICSPATPTARPAPGRNTPICIKDKKSNAEYRILTTTKNGGTVTLRKPLKDSSRTEIPATVTSNGKKYKVTAIAAKAFYGRKKLKEVTIGKYITEIGTKAFYNCTALREITLPAKVNKIGAFAFYNCRKMNAISIESRKLTSKSIGRDAFYRAGNINYKKLIVDVPTSKLRAYTSLLRRRGMSAKTIIMPPGGNIEDYMPAPDPVELSRNFVSLNVKKTNANTYYGKTTVKLKRQKYVTLKTVTCTVKKPSIASVTLKGSKNLTMKVKAKKKGSTKVVLSVRYQKGWRIRTKKLILEVEVSLKDTRSKKPAAAPTVSDDEPDEPDEPELTPTPQIPTPEPGKETPQPGTQTPQPDSQGPSPKPTYAPQKAIKKSADEVAALKEIIKAQKALGADVSEEDVDNNSYVYDVSGGNFGINAYFWDTEGHLIQIHWMKCHLKGALSTAKFKYLKTLYCYENELTSLDVNANTALTDLDCSRNQLSSLDTSANTALTWLWCWNNQLTFLNLSMNTSLTELWCGNNQLTSLDLTKNTALTNLSCDGTVIVTGYNKN